MPFHLDLKNERSRQDSGIFFSVLVRLLTICFLWILWSIVWTNRKSLTFFQSHWSVRGAGSHSTNSFTETLSWGESSRKAPGLFVQLSLCLHRSSRAFSTLMFWLFSVSLIFHVPRCIYVYMFYFFLLSFVILWFLCHKWSVKDRMIMMALFPELIELDGKAITPRDRQLLSFASLILCLYSLVFVFFSLFSLVQFFPFSILRFLLSHHSMWFYFATCSLCSCESYVFFCLDDSLKLAEELPQWWNTSLLFVESNKYFGIRSMICEELRSRFCPFVPRLKASESTTSSESLTEILSFHIKVLFFLPLFNPFIFFSIKVTTIYFLFSWVLDV